MTHYFINDENLKSDIKLNNVKINDKKFTFYTDNGVFSKKGLDFGTRTLLDSLNITDIKGKVLDFGCGYGPIGIYISSMTDAIVHMIDVNRRSLELARKNVDMNHVNANIYESDIYSNVHDKFDYIISNPPIRVGKKILYQIIKEAKNYLVKDGEFWIVINKNQGAKSLIKDFSDQYKIEVKTKNKGFYVICLINN